MRRRRRWGRRGKGRGKFNKEGGEEEEKEEVSLRILSPKKFKKEVASKEGEEKEHICEKEGSQERTKDS